MQSFVAIDFETANECPSSVCSVGVVIVHDGEFIERFYSLIHPEADELIKLRNHERIRANRERIKWEREHPKEAKVKETIEEILAAVFLIAMFILVIKGLHCRYLLIDTRTGYRNIFKEKSFLINTQR